MRLSGPSKDYFQTVSFNVWYSLWMDERALLTVQCTSTGVRQCLLGLPETMTVALSCPYIVLQYLSWICS